MKHDACVICRNECGEEEVHIVNVAIVHDYLTQRGGAERVVLELARAFPEAPIYTSLFEPASTFPEFDSHDVRPMPSLNRVKALRNDHRRAFPLLAPAFSRLSIEEDVAVCSSSGWAHGVRTNGKKLVYCHTPARWLYQTDRYIRHQSLLRRLALATLKPALLRWDRRRARDADVYIANSQITRKRILESYGIDAEVIHPPHSIDSARDGTPVPNLKPGYWLSVSRLLPYKNVDVIVDAFRRLPDRQLVIVGDGPMRTSIQSHAPANIHLLGTVSDSELRWLYMNATATIAASYEDFGLTPIEAAAFGVPSVAINWGGYQDTIIDGETGVLVNGPTARELVRGVRELERISPERAALRQHAEKYSADAFITRMRDIVSTLS